MQVWSGELVSCESAGRGCEAASIRPGWKRRRDSKRGCSEMMQRPEKALSHPLPPPPSTPPPFRTSLHPNMNTVASSVSRGQVRIWCRSRVGSASGGRARCRPRSARERSKARKVFFSFFSRMREAETAVSLRGEDPPARGPCEGPGRYRHAPSARLTPHGPSRLCEEGGRRAGSAAADRSSSAKRADPGSARHALPFVLGAPHASAGRLALPSSRQPRV